jgi:hypothetical protein
MDSLSPRIKRDCSGRKTFENLVHSSTVACFESSTNTAVGLGFSGPGLLHLPRATSRQRQPGHEKALV